MSTFHFSAYIEVKHLSSGHSDTVNSLSFSPAGTHLASGGDDLALCIWNVSKGQLLYRLLFDEAVDAVLWHPIHPETVIVGLSNGYLGQVHGFSLVRSNDIFLGARSTVYCLDYDVNTSCLAIGMGEEVHVTREVSQNLYDGDIVFPGPPDPIVENGDRDARLRTVAVKFHKAGTNLIASYVGHGIMYVSFQRHPSLRLRFSSILGVGIQRPGIRYSASSLSPSQRYIVVYNGVNGLDLYNVGVNGPQSPRKIYKFKERPRSPHHLQVQFIHGGKALLCGTTTGAVLVWETGSGEPLQELSHGGKTIEHTATTSDKHSLIATGSAAKGQGTYIKIWRARIGTHVPIHAKRRRCLM
ncbi:WD40 repeat-like protein [Lentinus tigrinus ALCF2SS1-6]|uniref:WD40 repeat-like protein n=1 Tax=Lentinus tigrinus ALCF2SS1-6 TaxID=1328759 RepID=A0A5C2SED5_9APHY|nr:WD40 repeat-like protein [Lentinus tigrinus ALCF2SS1-6]